MKPRIQGDIPEVFVSTVTTTGLRGGDAGHGGETRVAFSTGGSGCNRVIVEKESGEVIDLDMAGVVSVILISRGDWEQDGLHDALASAARQTAV